MPGNRSGVRGLLGEGRTKENMAGQGRERQTDKKTERQRKEQREQVMYDIAAARSLGAGQWDSLLLTGGPRHTASHGSRVPASTKPLKALTESVTSGFLDLFLRDCRAFPNPLWTLRSDV